MDAPVKELREIETLLGRARTEIATQKWDMSEKTLGEVLKRDMHNADAHDLMAEIAHGRKDIAGEQRWRASANAIRKSAWQRQVEAEVRGHHEVFGEPGRHEIP
jgi:hypothetical protein